MTSAKRRPRPTTPFAKTLTRLMDERGIGVREASRIAEVAASTIVSWRGGALPEDFQAVKRVARALGVTLSFLLTGEDDSRPGEAPPSVSEVFDSGGTLFDGYAKISIERLIPKGKRKEES